MTTDGKNDDDVEKKNPDENRDKSAKTTDGTDWTKTDQWPNCGGRVGNRSEWPNGAETEVAGPDGPDQPTYQT